MGRNYTPRRAGAHWREAAPDYILDVFDDPRTADRYTVIFGGKDWTEGDGTYAGTWLHYLGMSGAPTHPQGFSQFGELEAHQAMNYRYRNGRYRIRWLDLPEHIRAHIVARASASE